MQNTDFYLVIQWPITLTLTKIVCCLYPFHIFNCVHMYIPVLYGRVSWEMNLEAISISLRYLTGSLFTVLGVSACVIIIVGAEHGC